MTTEYLNTLWIISIITMASVVLLPLLAWIIGYIPAQETET